MHGIIIDDEFRDLLRPLSDDELDGLTERLLSEGVRDPLVVWDETSILLDGHHRLAIAEECDLNYELVRLSFATRDEARRWMLDNQASRRNWNKDERNEWMRTKRAEGWTYQRIADSAGVSQPTAIRVAGDVIPETTNVVSADGKMRPASYQRQDNGGPYLVAESEDDVLDAAKQIVKQRSAERQAQRNEIPLPPPPTGMYRCIVIDPPWPVAKIERIDRPNQGADLDYPTMTIEEIAAMPIPALAFRDGCHVYMWVTHKFLPVGLELFGRWGVRYECLLTWNKPTGMTPFSWMYNTEHVLFGRIGSLPLDKMGQKLSFDGAIVRHSQKPDAFYDRVISASPAPRLELFSRSERDGFAVWGNEVTA